MESLYSRRLARVRENMTGWGADLLVLNFGPDFIYLTGMEGPLYYTTLKGYGDWVTSVIVSQEHDPVIVLHPWFNVDVHTWVPDMRVMPADEQNPDAFLANILNEFAPAGKTVAIGKMAWASTLLSLQEAAPTAIFIQATNAMMDEMRSIKDPEEIEILQKASEITDISLAETIKRMKPGMTERDVQIEVEYQIRLAGGDGPSFPCGIISVGNGSDPNRHIFTRNTDLRLEPGMSVAFDFGVLYKGYCSDFGRSVFIGEPNPEALKAYQIITSGNLATMPKIKSDTVTPADIANIFRDWVAEHDPDLVQYYMYEGLGHAIGLEVHEEPWIKQVYTDPIRSNMVFTLEPKIWKPGVFYVRCEDMVVVGPEGSYALTHAPYDPIVVS
jgi:Xaa-Pro aminopeptidase